MREFIDGATAIARGAIDARSTFFAGYLKALTRESWLLTTPEFAGLETRHAKSSSTSTLPAPG